VSDAPNPHAPPPALDGEGELEMLERLVGHGLLVAQAGLVSSARAEEEAMRIEAARRSRSRSRNGPAPGPGLGPGLVAASSGAQLGNARQPSSTASIDDEMFGHKQDTGPATSLAVSEDLSSSAENSLDSAVNRLSLETAQSGIGHALEGIPPDADSESRRDGPDLDTMLALDSRDRLPSRSGTGLPSGTPGESTVIESPSRCTGDLIPEVVSQSDDTKDKVPVTEAN